jgi:hypothetical protein
VHINMESWNETYHLDVVVMLTPQASRIGFPQISNVTQVKSLQ